MKSWWLRVAGIVSLVLAAVLIFTLVQSPVRKGATTASSTTNTVREAAQRTQSSHQEVPAVPPSSLVATLSSTVTKFARPGGPPTGTVPGTWFGAPSALPVVVQANGYLEVRLAQRPNGSTAWIASSDATLTSTPDRIVVNLATEHLMLYRSGVLVLTAPAGIGTAQDPTPTGDFFVALVAAPPSSAWGPFIMVTSGHSNAISDWEQSGDAIVAIHGPLGADAAIGTTGARVSHGCVRLHTSDLLQLRNVPVGSPVVIVG